MYTRDKTYRDEKHSRSRRTREETPPSFSSTLLDEIYRSIDGAAADKPADFKAYRQNPVKKQSGCRAQKPAAAGDGDPTGDFVRACLVDKWIEKSKSEKPSPNSEKFVGDVMFFSSTSSSNSDSSGALSSSDTEFFGSAAEPKVSCFSTRPKPIKTGGPARKPIEKEEDPTKAKSRALRLYANLKKVKQPISPGGRLTSFINSLFGNAGAKKPKNEPSKDRFQSSVSACSSASSYSRSCLSKSSPVSRERMRGGSTQRTVRFNPVSVIVDEDSRACGHKSAFDEGRGKYEQRQPGSDLKLKGYNRKMSDDYASFRKRSIVVDEEDEYEDYGDDGMSDASSDLFELDHLAMFGNNTLKCEELPVYETTRLETNRVIAARSIR